ncbi:MAG: type I-E CRISPR-associated protein Cas7/Cse4/CasC [Nitratireductor sp.]
MSRFVQIHLLTHYPPSNPNRDDLGRPKTAIVGGAQRQRISSQAMKRALRTSDAFAGALAGNRGERTQRLGEVLRDHLIAGGADEAAASAAARTVAAAFGKIKSDGAQTEQLAFVSPREKARALELAEKALAGDELPAGKDLAKQVLQRADGAVDIAMFGRMLADNPDYNRDAAVQVSHALTTNAVTIEDDYYTAVDDLKTAAEDAGAGFVGEAGFGSGVYYIHVCVNTELLKDNLDGDVALARRGLAALVEALGEAVPSGKINSFSNHVRPEFMLVEHGDGQPLNLFSAFESPVAGPGLMAASVDRLRERRAAFARSYGAWWDEDLFLRVGDDGAATLEALAAFAAGAVEDGGTRP